jgi:hypothetical protein
MVEHSFRKAEVLGSTPKVGCFFLLNFRFAATGVNLLRYFRGRWMKTFQKCLIVMGISVFAFNASTIVHELGHALTVIATGGKFGFIEVTPFSWSYAHYIFAPEPMATSWGGILWSVIFGLLAFFVPWVAKSRLSFIGVLLAISSLAGEGTYLLVGTVFHVGDPASLLGQGVPPLALIVIGSLLLLLCFPLILPLGTLLDVGKGKNKLMTTVAVVSPIMAYLLAMLAYNLWNNQDEWLMWSADVGCGLILVVLVALAIHWTRPWCSGSETLRRAIPVNWRICVLCLSLGGGVVATEYLAFPKRPPISYGPITTLCWFEDDQNYAGCVREFDGNKKDRSSVFWKVNGITGQKTFPYMVWDAKWSSKLGKLIILTRTEILTVSPSGEMNSLLAEDWLTPLWRFNDDGSKIILTGLYNGEIQKYYLVAIDAVTGEKSSHYEIQSRPSGLVFTGANECVASTPDYRLTVSLNDTGQWQFERKSYPDPAGRIVAAINGSIVVELKLPEVSVMRKCRLSWKGMSVELPEFVSVFSWQDKLFVIAYDGAVYLVDSSMNAKIILDAKIGMERDILRTGAGVSSQGLWIAYQDGEVVTYDGAEQHFKLNLPLAIP